MHGYWRLEAGHRSEVTDARSAVVSSDVMVTPGCPHTDCRQSQCCPAPPRHHLAAAWLLSSCLDNVTCSGQHGVISASMFYISLSHFMDIIYALYCFFFFSMAKFPLFTSHYSVELKVNHETTISYFIY